ncbi:hypothetical protein F8C76_08325 [Flagellimonas olearia]|nr:hypothetical protein [Allomuricauda olearia]KAB7531484.1 hypothetical protein F8C76_08325 [Allomuricauda olearia]
MHDSHISLGAGPVFFTVVWPLGTNLLERVIKEETTNVALWQFLQKIGALDQTHPSPSKNPYNPGLYLMAL